MTQKQISFLAMVLSLLSVVINAAVLVTLVAR
jgi:hypothetical protein